MEIDKFLAIFAFLALGFSLVSASDPAPLNDFCVAPTDFKFAVIENGQLCEDPKLVTPNDFFYSGLNWPRIPKNVESNLTILTVKEIKGLNTNGLSIGRGYVAPNGVAPPGYHPRATEVLTVLQGTIYMGFITSNPDHRLFAKVLHPGDVFVTPKGLIHFVWNIGKIPSITIVAYDSQNPGYVTVTSSIFASIPPISPKILTKSFQLDKDIITYLQGREWVD